MKALRWEIFAAAFLLLFVCGCDGSSLKLPMKADKAPKAAESATSVQEVTKAPSPTAVPATVTPRPTSTPAPRMLGTKTIQSSFIFLTNSTRTPLREVYLKDADDYSDSWGKNLVSRESTVRSSETVQMFFDSPEYDNQLYDMKFVDKNGNAYAIYNIPLGDMTSAVYHVNEDGAYLSYLSKSENKEISTDVSDTLAKDYSSGYDDEDDHMGDPDYGYYNSEGIWTLYGDRRNSSTSSSSPLTNGILTATPRPNHNSSSDSSFSLDNSSSIEDHLGDPAYGYYDSEGNWVSYNTNETYYQQNTTWDSSSQDDNWNSNQNDNWDSSGYDTTDYSNPYSDSDSQVGNPEYGFYDEYNNWISY